ncbi:MAG TPA: hypothetical protein VK497_00825 [Candidatus Saccharimonadales bacterium]|nr:hypothetical protein [Candidatus Saccharimonadales bacterium]
MSDITPFLNGTNGIEVGIFDPEEVDAVYKESAVGHASELVARTPDETREVTVFVNETCLQAHLYPLWYKGDMAVLSTKDGIEDRPGHFVYYYFVISRIGKSTWEIPMTSNVVKVSGELDCNEAFDNLQLPEQLIYLF